jgi:hypothetical protein
MTTGQAIAQLILIGLIALNLLACFAVDALPALRRRVFRRRAIQITARQLGISEKYVAEAVANFEDLQCGRIDEQEWLRRAVLIDYRFPLDSGLRAELRREEGVL